jgi:hypothetical protein
MKRFLAIARGSAMECAAIVDVGIKLQIIEPKDAQEAKLLLHRIVSMLSKMIVSTNQPTTQTKTTTPTPTINRPPPRLHWSRIAWTGGRTCLSNSQASPR